MRSRMLLAVAAFVFLAALLPAAGASRTRSQLADAPWPMFHHDVQHTGRSPLLGPMSPLLKWRYATGGAVKSSPAIAADGTIYVGSYDGRLYALNANGSLAWRYATGGPIHSSPAVAADGTLYFGSDDGHLYALNRAGSLKWRYATVGSVRSSPAIGADGTVYVGSDCTSEDESPYLYAIHPDGTLKWRHDLSTTPPRPSGDSSPAIAPDGTVYVGTPTGELLAMNPDGSLKWLEWMVSTDILSSPAVAADGYIWVGCEYKGCLIQFRPDGSFARCLGGVTYGADVTSSPAIGADGTIYFGVDDRGTGFPGRTGHVAAWDPAASENDGLLWAFKADSAVDSSPAIGADGTVYVGSEDTYLYALNSDGTLSWRYKTGGGIFSSPAIGPGCTLYFGSDDGYVYAIQNGAALQYGAEGYTGSEDARIFKYAPSSNYCQEGQLELGYKQQHSALLRFDLSAIPENAVVSAATLQLYATGWGGSDLSIDAFRVLRSVNLCQATWNQAQSGSNWAVPGCNGLGSDRAALPEDSVTVRGPRRGYSLTLTSLVQAWVNGSLANNGVLLRGASASSTSLCYLASNQSSVLSQRPRLVVAYCLSGLPRATRTPAPTPTVTPTATPPPPETTVTLQYGAEGYEYSDDTYLYRYAATTNYCARNQFQVGYRQQNSALLRFVLPYTLPATARVTHATLQVYATGWGGVNTTIEAYRVLTYTSLCEATWEQATRTSRWAAPGCNGLNLDRSSAPESRVTTSGARKWYSLDLTDAVQGWTNGSLENHGVLLRGAGPTDTAMFYFASNETDPVSQRPRLVITYQ